MQLKRIFAILLAATLIFTAFAAPVNAAAVDANGTFEVGVVAETTAPVSASPAIYKSGDNVSVKISAVQNTGITILKFSIKYDPNALELIDWTSANLFDNLGEKINVENGSVTYVVMMNNTSTATGEMFTLNFKVNESLCVDTSINAQVFAANPKNCINGINVVSFVGGEASFAAHNALEAVQVIEPTCTEDGYTEFTCATCGTSGIVGNVVEALGHTEAAAVEENRIDENCAVDGSYDSVVYCATCNVELSRTEVILPAHGNHTSAPAVNENIVEATCLVAGSHDEVVYCSVCGKELSRVAVVDPALGHDLVSHDAQDPDCENIGWYAYETCSRCDYTTYVAIEHLCHAPTVTAIENLVNATCTADGSYESVVYCERCNEELSRETKVIPALGHDLTSYEAKAPTCTEIGWDAYDVCSRCDLNTYAEKAALGHTAAEAVEENRIEADCLNEGSYELVVYCATCGEELSREAFVIDALGHDLVSHDAQDPDCENIGWDAYETCNRCDYTTYQPIHPLCHENATTVIENVVEATCTEDGSYDSVIYCTRCEVELVRDTIVIEALGHAEAIAVEENRIEATCTEEGSYDSVVYCYVCDEELSREAMVIDALGHSTVSFEAKTPTCTEIGWDAYEICSVCGHSTYAEKAATGHKAAKAVVENRVEATCTKNGSYDNVVYCSVCFEELSRETKVLIKLGHDLVHHDAKAPTCTEIGWNAYDTCSRCDYTTYETIQHLCHEPAKTAVENLVEATCTAAGSFDSVVYCSRCDVELSRETKAIEAHGHTLVANEAKAATCIHIGWEAYNTCANCDYTTYVEIPATGEHTMSAWAPVGVDNHVRVCAHCGIMESGIHTFDDGAVTKNPTCYEDGVFTYTCTVCSDTKSEAIAMNVIADVSTSSWQFGFVAYAYDNGLMAGKGVDADGKVTFDPNSSITREQFVQVLYNAEGKPSVSIANEFTDVASNGWYLNAVLWAKESNIANGSPNGTFGVGANITRQDLAMMLYKYAQLKGYSLDAEEGKIEQFADSDKVADYAKTAMNWAVTQGVLSGKGTTGSTVFYLDPTGTATRAECAAMLKNFIPAFAQ